MSTVAGRRGAVDMPVVAVTGGMSGIGAATVTTLANAGWQVVVFDPAADPGVGRYWLDARDESAVAHAIADVCREYGRLDAVVHAAGAAQQGETALELTLERFREIVDINLVSSFVVARQAANVMDTDGGAIVLVSSASGVRARAGMSAYGPSKAAVIHLAKVMAREFANQGIRVNCVSPGVTVTPTMLGAWAARDVDHAFDMANADAPIPVGRLIEPDEVASCIAYLLSPAASAVTGHNLIVDGGRSV